MTQKDETPETGAERDEEQEPSSLPAALLAFQAEAPVLTKAAEGKVKGVSKQGKAYDYTFAYADYPTIMVAIQPLLTRWGLVWSCKPGENEQGRPVLRYRLLHVPSYQQSGLLGEHCEDVGTMPLILGANPTPQAYGSALTYGKRQALTAALNLVAEEDADGAAPAVVEKRITKGVAAQLVGEAVKLGLLGRLQLAASHVHGADVGDCSTEAKAVKAALKLSEGDAERLFAKLSEIGAAAQNAAEAPDD